MSLIAPIRAVLGHGTGGWAKSRIPLHWLALSAGLAFCGWLAAEQLVRAMPHPRQFELVLAANNALAAAQEIARIKERAGLLQSTAPDPNRTGLIGPDWSEITTTIGDLPAKRTVTNPDLAAALARILLARRLPPEASVGLVLSGSFVGANVAAIAAVEALGLRPVIVTSIGASMYGATDPGLTWLDMEAAVARAKIWRARSVLAVLGGESGIGNSLSGVGREMLTSAARRNDLEPVQAEDFAALKIQVTAALNRTAPEGLAALISTGGSVLAMGTCQDAYRLPSGSVQGKLPCADGVPGLVHDFSARGIPVLHILNIKRLALEWGLPYDPVPLPKIGENTRIYRRMAFP